MHLKATGFRLTEEPAILEGEGSVQLPQEREGNMGTASEGWGGPWYAWGNKHWL